MFWLHQMSFHPHWNTPQAFSQHDPATFLWDVTVSYTLPFWYTTLNTLWRLFSEFMLALKLSKLVWYIYVSNLTCPLFPHCFAFDKLTEFWQIHSPKLSYSAHHPIQIVSPQKTKNTSSVSPAGDHLQAISMPLMQTILFYFSCKNICHLKYSPLIH